MHYPELFRIRTGIMASDRGESGAFHIPFGVALLTVIASANCMGWDHVSVSTLHRCPNWEEMCFIKKLFWGEDDCIVQFHPAKKNYINNHPFCLHLWKCLCVDFPVPPAVLV